MATKTQITALGVAAASGGVVPLNAEPLPSKVTYGKQFGGIVCTLPNVTLPAGDWSVGMWFSLASWATNRRGMIFTIGSKLKLHFDNDPGTLRLSGTDDAAVTLGSHAEAGYYGSTAVGVLSTWPITTAQDVFIVCQKRGNYAEIWLAFNGCAPVLVSSEYTTFGACAASTLTIGGGGTPQAYIRDFFKLQYSLTLDQITQVANGVDPTTLGTYGATDFLFKMNGASNSTFSSTINSLTTTWGGGSTSDVGATGLGWATQSEAVFVTPPCSDGGVIQHVNGSATINLTGTYVGTDGGAIQVQFLDQNNTCFKGWTTVATNITGKTWSGTVTVPKGKRWIKMQCRKAGSTQVMTTQLRWGVGENVILSGQSLMDYLRNTGYPYSSSGTYTANGFVSFHSSMQVIQSGSGTEVLTITGAANAGGLIQITTTGKHGRMSGDKVTIGGIVGTTEANNRVWTIDVTGTNTFTLRGSVFVNAYTSGGSCYIGKHYQRIPESYDTQSDSMAIIGNAISNKANCVVCVANRAVGGTNIANHYSWTQNTAPYTLLTGHNMGRVSIFAWMQGHNDVGLSPISQYFSSGGTEGAWTGWGLLGTLYDFYKTNLPNNDFYMGVVPFTSVTAQVSNYNYHSFRWGMYDWCVRKIANNENVFVMSFIHECQPQLESNGIGAHLVPGFKGALSLAARIGHDVGTKLAKTGSNAMGPRIVSATRTGQYIDLTIAHNGGSTLKTKTVGARPSGFEVASDSNFTSPLSISNVAISDDTHIRITLSSDPGATCYIRYMYPRGINPNGFIDALVTGVASNGSGLIRVTCAAATTIPANFQRTGGGHGLSGGEWVRIVGVNGSTQANGEWQVQYVSSTQFDLVGSTDVGLGTYINGNNLGTGGSAVVETLLAIPVYDNVVVGGYDTLGAPLRPTYSTLVVL